MLQNWNKLAMSQIKNDKILWRDFQTDYETYTGRKLSGCKKCLMEKHYELLKIIKSLTGEKPQIIEQMSKYTLKPKYQGILFENKVYQNGKFTDKEAEHLLKNHKKGAELFAELPTKDVKEHKKPKEKIEKVDVNDIDSTIEVIESEN